MDIVSLIIAFIFPFFIFLIALYYLIRKPKINDKLFGYRTERSMRNEFIYQKAQVIFGKQLLIGGLIATVFGYGFLTVSSIILKVLLIISEFVAVANFGMRTEFILIKRFGK